MYRKKASGKKRQGTTARKELLKIEQGVHIQAANVTADLFMGKQHINTQVEVQYLVPREKATGHNDSGADRHLLDLCSS